MKILDLFFNNKRHCTVVSIVNLKRNINSVKLYTGEVILTILIELPSS